MRRERQANEGIPIQNLATQSRGWTPNLFATTVAETCLLWLPSDATEDEDGEWAYQTTYVRSVPEADGRIAFIDIKLTLVYPLRKARKGAFADTMLVGRAASNDVCIDHTSISKLHARIRHVGERAWRLSDAGSLNGTQLNGEPVSSEVPIRDTDKVSFGAMHFEVYDAKRLHHLLTRLR